LVKHNHISHDLEYLLSQTMHYLQLFRTCVQCRSSCQNDSVGVKDNTAAYCIDEKLKYVLEMIE